MCERQGRVRREFRNLQKGNLKGLQSQPLFEAAVDELDMVSLGKSPRELLLMHLEKIGPKCRNDILRDKRIWGTSCEATAVDTWREAHQILIEVEALEGGGRSCHAAIGNRPDQAWSPSSGGTATKSASTGARTASGAVREALWPRPWVRQVMPRGCVIANVTLADATAQTARTITMPRSSLSHERTGIGPRADRREAMVTASRARRTTRHGMKRRQVELGAGVDLSVAGPGKGTEAKESSGHVRPPLTPTREGLVLSGIKPRAEEERVRVAEERETVALAEVMAKVVRITPSRFASGSAKEIVGMARIAITLTAKWHTLHCKMSCSPSQLTRQIRSPKSRVLDEGHLARGVKVWLEGTISSLRGATTRRLDLSWDRCEMDRLRRDVTWSC